MTAVLFSLCATKRRLQHSKEMALVTTPVRSSISNNGTDICFCNLDPERLSLLNDVKNE